MIPFHAARYFLPVVEECCMPSWRALVPLPVLLAAACTSPPAETATRLVYPALPPTLCARAPSPPKLEASDNAWAAYKQARDAAGDDCRDKLDAVRAVVAGWPSPP
jgi:hypothetical protein